MVVVRRKYVKGVSRRWGV